MLGEYLSLLRRNFDMSHWETRSEVERAIERFFQLVSTRDMRVLAEFAPSDDLLLIGSDEGEIARGRSEIEAFFTRIFSRTSTFSWQAHSVDVFQADGITRFFANGQMIVESKEGQETLPYRISGVLERYRGRWLWRQYHVSEPKAIH
jgi:ketosteroid isomerase-like protein